MRTQPHSQPHSQHSAGEAALSAANETRLQTLQTSHLRLVQQVGSQFGTQAAMSMMSTAMSMMSTALQSLAEHDVAPPAGDGRKRQRLDPPPPQGPQPPSWLGAKVSL